MAKDAVLQVRMEAELKRQAEELFESLGTSLVEIVRLMVLTSVQEQRVPFDVYSNRKSLRGALHQYANPDLVAKEADAWEMAMRDKYENNN